MPETYKTVTMMFLLALVGCSSGDDPVDAGPSSGELFALTYNVHGLPEIVTGDDTPGRMRQIGPLLNTFDIVGMQEDFEDPNHEILTQASEHETQARFFEALSGRGGYGSGLALFSILDELEHEYVHFDDCVGMTNHGSDCLASKGVMAVRLDLDGGLSLDIYNTHMEAGGSEDDAEARSAQMDQIIETMLRWSEGRAILFLGDTNCHGSDPEDVVLIERLIENVGLAEGCDLVGCPEPGRIDRLMFRDGDDLSLHPTVWTVEPAFFDSEGVPLSDHDAISMHFTWERR